MIDLLYDDILMTCHFMIITCNYAYNIASLNYIYLGLLLITDVYSTRLRILATYNYILEATYRINKEQHKKQKMKKYF